VREERCLLNTQLRRPSPDDERTQPSPMPTARGRIPRDDPPANQNGRWKDRSVLPEWTWFISARKSSVAGSVTAGPALFAQLRSCHRRLPNGGRYATKYEARRYRKSLQYQSPKQP
jgi:hypothetical protein